MGNGFPLKDKKAFLVGGGIGIPPMLELAKQLNCHKDILLGYRDKLFLNRDFESYGNVYIATEDGSAGVQGVVMLEGSKRKQSAWDFIDWYTDADFQASYSNELVALLGDAGMNPTANIEALAELSWTSTEYNNLRSQFDALTAVPNYPGSYIIARYTDFAFKAAYNDGADPTTALLGYINTINKEFSRKREEFGLETLEVGQKLSDKRIEQARDEISKVSASERDKYKSQLDALTAAMDAATGISVRKGDLDALVSATNALKATGSSTFDTAVKFLDDAIAALNTYQLSAE